MSGPGGQERSAFLTGHGRYAGDGAPTEALHAVFVRSLYPHARLGSVTLPAGSTGATLHTGAALAAVCRPLRIEGPGLVACDWLPLAAGRVRYVGEPVAVVVAASRALAEDAADAVAVEYEPLPAVASVATALAGGAMLHDEAPDNVLFRRQFNAGGTEALFAAAPVVVEREYRYPRQTAVPLESRGGWARHDPRTGVTLLHTSTQIPHIVRSTVAACLGEDEEAIHVVRPDVGGGFGLKSHVFGEEIALVWLARLLGRPVRWQEDRRENLSASAHAHEQTVRLAVAADRHGHLLAVRAQVKADVGAHHIHPLSASLEPVTSATSLFGPYRYQAVEYEALGVATNKVPTGAYRGVGLNAAVFATERLLDVLAAELGIAPAELRARNLLDAAEFPYTTPAGRFYDSGDYAGLLRLALARQAEQCPGVPEARAIERVGVGIAAFNEHTGTGSRDYRARGIAELPGYDATALRIAADGAVTLLLSSSSTGQDYAGTFSRLVARELGIAAHSVRVVEGDTALCPPGTGTFVSRGAVAHGGATLLACAAMKERLALFARHLLKVEGAIVFADGRVAAEGRPDRSLAFADLAAAAHLRLPGATLPEGYEPGLALTRFYDPPYQLFSASVHIATVAVDPETGTVRLLRYVVAEDCGNLLDAASVDGQIRGATVQGIGCALLEAVVYDEDAQLLTGSLMDYLVPTATDAPAIEIVHQCTPSTTQGGFKGAGESGTIGAPAAIANAVASALGVEVNDLPLSPDRVLGYALQAEEQQ